MRLKPEISADEAFQWLSAESERRWGPSTDQASRLLRTLAADMATISAVDLPDGTEPGAH